MNGTRKGRTTRAENTRPTDPIAELAAYLTGPRAIKHNIGLQVGGPAALEASEFFALRLVMGVHGYQSQAQAEENIRAVLSEALA